MRNVDQRTSLFWLVLSIFVCIQSIRIGIGQPHNPGMGFVPFFASSILGVLSCSLFIMASLTNEGNEIRAAFAGKRWKRVMMAIIALFFFTWFVPIAGYCPATFLFMVIIFKIAGFRRWWKVIVYAFITTLITYILFSILLGVQFPRGPLGC